MKKSIYGQFQISLNAYPTLTMPDGRILIYSKAYKHIYPIFNIL